MHDQRNIKSTVCVSSRQNKSPPDDNLIEVEVWRDKQLI